MGPQMATDPISIQQLRNASEDAKDLERFVNDDAAALISTRLGGLKPNYAKLLADRNADFQQFLLKSGYEELGEYGPGLNIVRRNQVFRKGGEFYRAAASLGLPYTTTGVWAAESSKFVAVGDAVLRQELATVVGGEGGSDKVSHLTVGGATTSVGDALRAIDTSVTASQLQSLDTFSVDMHFGILRGLGWNIAETPYVENVTAATVAVAAGARAIPVSNAAGFVAPQLIVYRGADTFYYTAVIDSIAGNTLNLRGPTEVAISQGGVVANAYRDDAHPNQYGAKAIADGTLRGLNYAESIVAVQRNYQEFTKYGAGTVAGDSSFDYANPGAQDVANRAAKITAPGSSDGAFSPPISLPAGTYRVSVPVRIVGTAQLLLQETTKEGQQLVVASASESGNNWIKLFSLIVSIRPGSSLSLFVLNGGTTAASFSVGRISYFRIDGRSPSFDRGTIVLFGDSWINGGYITERLRERLPNARIIQSGQGGDTMEILLSRFAADVAPHRPDWVFVMAGTNDAYQMYSAKKLETDALVLKSRIKGIGARSVFWNSSVCNKDYSGGDRLTGSRQYAIQIDYCDQVSSVDWQGAQQRTCIISVVPGRTIGVGETVVLGVVPKPVTKSVRLRSSIGSSAGMTISLGYGPTMDTTTLTGSVSWDSAAAANDRIAIKTDEFPAFAILTARNDAGGAVNLSLVADIAYYID